MITFLISLNVLQGLFIAYLLNKSKIDAVEQTVVSEVKKDIIAVESAEKAVVTDIQTAVKEIETVPQTVKAKVLSTETHYTDEFGKLVRVVKES